MIFSVTVDFDHFMRDLQAGDPVVLAIVAGMLLFSGIACTGNIELSRPNHGQPRSMKNKSAAIPSQV